MLWRWGGQQVLGLVENPASRKCGFLVFWKLGTGEMKYADPAPNRPATAEEGHTRAIFDRPYGCTWMRRASYGRCDGLKLSELGSFDSDSVTELDGPSVTTS